MQFYDFDDAEILFCTVTVFVLRKHREAVLDPYASSGNVVPALGYTQQGPVAGRARPPIVTNKPCCREVCTPTVDLDLHWGLLHML